MKAARWTPRRRSFSSKAPTVAQSRWRTQPATVNKPKNLTSGDPKFGLSAKLEQTLLMNEGASSGNHNAVPTAILRRIERTVGGGDHILYRFTNAIRKRRAKAPRDDSSFAAKLKRGSHDRLA